MSLKWKIIASIIALLLVGPGCAAFPIDFGVTASTTPQFGISACVLAAEPIVIGQAKPAVHCYGWSQGYLLYGSSADSAYAKSAGVS